MNPPGPHATLTVKMAYVLSEALKATLKPRDAKIKELEAQVAELQRRPIVKDAGVWTAGETYAEGSLVTYGGGAWICRGTHFSTGTAPSHDHFRLLIKSPRR